MPQKSEHLEEHAHRMYRKKSPHRLRQAFWIFLQHWSPRLLLLFALIAFCCRHLLGPWTYQDGFLGAIMVIFWGFQEWLVHNFLLHWKPMPLLGREIDLTIAISHREHHAQPWDVDMAFTPLQVYTWAPFVLVGFWFLAMPSAELALTGILSYIVLGLHYEWFHFLVHTRYRPKNIYYRQLWRNHRMHHFKNENFWYGMTLLYGDLFFKTNPTYKNTPFSAHCQDLLAEKHPH